MKYRSNVLVLSVILLSISSVLGAQSEKVPRAALIDFTSDDGLYRSGVAASQIASLVQAELLDHKDFEWVERSQLQRASEELDLSAATLVSGASSLRIGKWVKADILVMGHFRRNEKDGHTLLLEVVDLGHADVLAERSILIPGERRAAITVAHVDVLAIAKALREASQEALKRLLQTRDQKVIAPLFFKNEDSSPRLNFFEQELVSTFQNHTAEMPDVRVLRFPRASESAGEAELVLLGLTESDQSAWQKVADVYVWGTYHELSSVGLSFEQTPVEITLNVWNGKGVPVRSVEKTTVAGLKLAAAQIAKRTIQLAQKISVERHPSSEARNDVALWLMESAAAKRKTIASFGPKTEDFLATDAGKALGREVLTTLQTICFFDPGNREARLELVQIPALPSRTSKFFQHWKKSNELGDFTKRFGQGEDVAANFDLAYQNVNSGGNLFYEIRRPGSLPFDAPDEVVKQWQNTLEGLFVKKVIHVHRIAQQPGAANRDRICSFFGHVIRTALDEMTNPSLAVEIIELLWPRYKPYYLKGISYSGDDNRVEADLRRLYASIGKPGRVSELVAPFPPDSSVASKEQVLSTATTNRPVAFPQRSGPLEIIPMHDSMRPMVKSAESEGLPPLLHPVIRSLAFPQSSARALGGPSSTYYYSTKALGMFDQQLWISVQSMTTNRVDDRLTWLPCLFRYNPATNALENISEKIGKHSQITSILGYLDRVWLTLEFDGVWNVAPKTWEVRKFEAKDGVLTPNMGASAAVGDKLAFGGGRERAGLLNILDTASMTWSRLDRLDLQPMFFGTTKDIINVVLRPGGPVREMCSFKHWLIAGSYPWSIYDTQTGKGRNLETIFGLNTPDLASSTNQTTVFHPILPDSPAEWEPYRPILNDFMMGGHQEVPLVFVRSCSSDETGYWIVLTDRLTYFNPVNDDNESWSLPFPKIAASAQDHEYLWVVSSWPYTLPIEKAIFTDSEQKQLLKKQQEATSNIMIFHKPSKKWVGYFGVKGVVNSICVSDASVYLGLQYGLEPVLAVDKGTVLPAAKGP